MNATVVAPDLDLTVLEALEWAPPCEYRAKDVCQDAAEWALLLPPTECGCRPLRTVFHCTACIEMWSKADVHFCPDCRHVITNAGVLSRVRIGVAP